MIVMLLLALCFIATAGGKSRQPSVVPAIIVLAVLALVALR